MVQQGKLTSETPAFYISGCSSPAATLPIQIIIISIEKQPMMTQVLEFTLYLWEPQIMFLTSDQELAVVAIRRVNLLSLSLSVLPFLSAFQKNK